ncbi:MAG: carboxypeptidase-like regulatory domain-containing protein [Planctomycetes bacterium]|nr:carboxypeptidase-like regulatory domain-containing protein [Planctomycetota bacterium]
MFSEIRLALASCLGVALFSLAGCSSAPEEPWNTVFGTIKVDGVAPTGATVRLHYLGDPVKINQPQIAQVNADGSFTLAVRPPGEYAVTFFWPEISTKSNDEKTEGADRLKSKYDRVEKPAATVKVNAGETKLPAIDLKRR